MRYFEVNFHISPDSEASRDILSALAGEAGFEAFDVENGLLTGYVQQQLFDRQRLDDILAEFPMPGVSISYDCCEAANKDWNSEWEQTGFDPIVIDDRCIVYDAKRGLPSVAKEDDKESHRLLIGIDAVQAFGTGTHATTQMIVGMLMDMPMKGLRVLDCGCGTGILSIVAAKRGASVSGYDIDEWSASNARHNADLNHVKIDVHEGDKKVLGKISGEFNLVMANINRNILLSDMDAFKAKMAPGAQLIISGFYADDVPLLLAKASQLGLRLCRQESREGWCCLLLQA